MTGQDRHTDVQSTWLVEARWIQFANKSIQLLDPLPGTYPAGSTGMLK